MKTVRVLIVDDVPQLASVLCRVISLSGGDGWEAESCASAPAALARLADTKFDVLVTDLCLPEIDGFELIRRAKAIRPDSPPRTVLITAYSTWETEAASLRIADAYLAKPFDLEHFMRTVRDVLESNASDS